MPTGIFSYICIHVIPCLQKNFTQKHKYILYTLMNVLYNANCPILYMTVCSRAAEQLHLLVLIVLYTLQSGLSNPVYITYSTLAPFHCAFQTEITCILLYFNYLFLHIKVSLRSAVQSCLSVLIDRPLHTLLNFSMPK